jgi:hypothetical protein
VQKFGCTPPTLRDRHEGVDAVLCGLPKRSQAAQQVAGRMFIAMRFR